MTLRFGGVTSLNNVSLQMHRGEILAVIGPNGAGKTSLFNSLTGVYTPQEGTITLAARKGDTLTSVLGQKTHVINRMGVARTFQNIRLFPALTALENVKVGVETRQKSGPIAVDARHAVAASRGARVAPRRPTSCCASSASPAGPTTSPARWRTASSDASRSPAPSAPSPG